MSYPENSPSLAGRENERQRLLEQAIQQFRSARLTFTESDIFAALWQAGYEVTPEDEPRLVLSREGDGKHLPHWRLNTQSFANNRLLDRLMTGTWDGRNLEQELEKLDREDGLYYVFCPVDPRFQQAGDGTWEPAFQEKNIVLPEATRSALERLAPALLERWRETGTQPWTIQKVKETLGALGWEGAAERAGWLTVRAWLQEWAAVERVGQDYWVLVDHLPQGPKHTRLQVLPMPPTMPEEHSSGEAHVQPAQDTVSETQSTEPALEDLIPPEGRTAATLTSWVTPLRTVHLTQGFVPVPASARSAYPPLSYTSEQKEWAVVRGKWFETNEDMWVWLNRSQHLLCGPDLANQLEWLDAGQRLRITWTPDALIFRLAGIHAEIQHEESRLVDREALAALRGGLGESYRASVLAILREAPSGLTFPEIVRAIEQRQQHPVHRGTVRALLAAGGFIQQQRRWFATVDEKAGARQLRRALLDALTPPPEDTRSEVPGGSPGRLHNQISMIRSRLRELMTSSS